MMYTANDRAVMQAYGFLSRIPPKLIASLP